MSSDKGMPELMKHHRAKDYGNQRAPSPRAHIYMRRLLTEPYECKEEEKREIDPDVNSENPPCGNGPASHRSYVILYGWGFGCRRLVRWCHVRTANCRRRRSREAANKSSPTSGKAGHEMRVIAGKFRSRQLRSLGGLDIRPTSDRLRETLFNVLTAGNPRALEGSIWLDLFAGTGAVGIEAISRGAAMVYFVERAKPVAEQVRQNLQSLGITQGFQIMQQESVQAITQLQRQQIRPDYIFLDPPYSLWDACRETLETLGDSNVRSLVIAEHEKRFDPGERFGGLQRSRKLLQGDAGLSFYRRTESAS
jgi:16S rRNA (guanine966-N2)-methyltransferase